jgi:hypothetical protein
MTTTSNSNDPSRDDAVTRELLLSADRHEIEPPRDLLDRVRARLHENTVQSPLPVPVRATAPWSKRVWFAAAGTAAVVLIALFFSLQSSSVAWSQVAEAVRALPWIHMKAVSGQDKSREMWISVSRNVIAARDSKTIRYDDLGSRIVYAYDLHEKKLFRLSATNHVGNEVKFMEEIFQAIFRGNAIRGEEFLGPKLIRQRQRKTTEDGRQWILYELDLGIPNDSDPTRTFTIIIRVDPEKKLPQTMTIVHVKEKMGLAIDYPTEGPADIYALGVPRGAPVDDRTPPPDLNRILKIIQQNRHTFDDYLGVAGGSESERPSVVRLIRCKGMKFRIDVGVGDTRHVASAADLGRWWWEHGKEILPEGSVLCDGRHIYEHNLVSPKDGWKPLLYQIKPSDDRAATEKNGIFAQYFVELLAYPQTLSPENLSSASFITVHLDLKGENGPAGSVRVERLIGYRGDNKFDSGTFHKEEFWLQPKYGYALVKHVISDCPQIDKDPHRKDRQIVYEYDGYRQTPRGLWYPTVSRHKNAIPSRNKSKSGVNEFCDEVTYFYLYFAAEMPDELFTMGFKGDLLRGIDFARHGERLAPNDLGKIRPPGGVPLFFGGPGSEISVDGVERARRRLEAVPGKDLEKWVVELERIIDQRLEDGLPSSRQVCRTDFVVHLSVAFDGLKWNAKTADNLFKRAETLPASEGKVWREAFEALLKNKIGQTDTRIFAGGPAWAVPLALIPVDALFEGQKYSTERAKKYLARLKRLTADDVALWIDKVDEFGGTRLDAAMNIILLDDYFDKEKFQRDKFKAAIEARKK